MQRRTTEDEVRGPILDTLRSGATMTTQEIRRSVKARIYVANGDKVGSDSRLSEAKIDAIIANALQEKRYLCKREFIRRLDKDLFKITPEGLTYLNEMDAMSDTLRSMFPDDLD